MKTKKRGNKQGTAYKRGSTWEAQVIVGWRIPEDINQNPVPIKKRKTGFLTKKDALDYCFQLKTAEAPKSRPTLQQVYEQWEKAYAPRVGESTMVCYKSAYKHFESLKDIFMDLITARDLQECMDKCESGKRTHQNMKVTAGLIWAYAVDAEIVNRDVTNNLYIGKGETKQREPITDDELKVIRKAIGQEPYAEYIYALCYLGFRPGEFLALTKADLHKEGDILYLVGGSKTDAGKNRKVPVPDAIQDIIKTRSEVEGTDYLFPQYNYDAHKKFRGFKKMSDAYFRESVFKPLMAKLGIAEGKVPYGARHTYSDKLKNAAGDDKAKAALMGHTNYDFTKKKYQSTSIEDLQAVVNSIT